MPTLTPHTLLTRNPDLIATDMDGDLVMMSIERGEYFGVGGVGPRVWELLAQPASVAQLAETICAEYEVDATTCLPDMEAFAQALLQNGLVTPVATA